MEYGLEIEALNKNAATPAARQKRRSPLRLPNQAGDRRYRSHAATPTPSQTTREMMTAVSNVTKRLRDSHVSKSKEIVAGTHRSTRVENRLQFVDPRISIRMTAIGIKKIAIATNWTMGPLVIDNVVWWILFDPTDAPSSWCEANRRIHHLKGRV
jgi:hypothetical protein